MLKSPPALPEIDRLREQIELQVQAQLAELGDDSGEQAVCVEPEAGLEVLVALCSDDPPSDELFEFFQKNHLDACLYCSEAFAKIRHWISEM